jgi:hypothetical protein
LVAIPNANTTRSHDEMIQDKRILLLFKSFLVHPLGLGVYGALLSLWAPLLINVRCLVGARKEMTLHITLLCPSFIHLGFIQYKKVIWIPKIDSFTRECVACISMGSIEFFWDLGSLESTWGYELMHSKIW